MKETSIWKPRVKKSGNLGSRKKDQENRLKETRIKESRKKNSRIKESRSLR